MLRHPDQGRHWWSTAPARRGFVGDVAVKDGRIAAVGPNHRRRGAPHARRQRPRRRAGLHRPAHPLRRAAAVGRRGQPALEHGITSVVPGNCSLSLAPLKAERPQGAGRHVPADRGDAARSLHRGVRLDLGGLRRLPRRASSQASRSTSRPLVGHSVIRLWVMGADAQPARRAAGRDRRDAGPAARMPRCRRGRPLHQLRRRRRERPAGAVALRRRSSELDALCAPCSASTAACCRSCRSSTPPTSPSPASTSWPSCR